MRIQRLFIYPVKSLLPVEVEAAELTSEGLRFDRQFVIVKPSADVHSRHAEAFTIKATFSLCLLQPAINQEWSRLTITHTRATPPSSLTVPLTPSPVSLLNAPVYQVSIFGTVAWGVDMGDKAASFFTEHLGEAARLLYITGSGKRDIPGLAYGYRRPRTLSLVLDETSAAQPQRIRFADAAPLSITTTASELDARQRLPRENQDEDVAVLFRSNIHIASDEGAPAYDEDHWKLLQIRPSATSGQLVVVKCIFKCTRCLSVNVDMETGGTVPTRRQIYGLLAKDRRVNSAFPHRPVFGQYAFAGPANTILRVGDEVELSERE